MARQRTGKETSSERLERETVQEIGSVVAPSMLASPVLAYLLVLGSGSRYRVFFEDGSKEECSAGRLRQLLREDVAEEALA